MLIDEEDYTNHLKNKEDVIDKIVRNLILL